MIHTNDDIADLIQDTIQLMQKIDMFVDTESDHDCDYRNIYRTHKLMVTSFLQKLNELTNEKVSIQHINPRDLMQTLEELKTQPASRSKRPARKRLHKPIPIGEMNE